MKRTPTLAILLFASALAACGDDTPAPINDTTVTDTFIGDTAVANDTTVADTVAGDATTDVSTPGDTTVEDGTAPADAATDDVSTPGDTSTDTSANGTVPLEGFGAISGTCGFIDDELFDPAPSFVVNALDFGTDAYDEADLALLSDAGQEIIRDGNAGGSSLLSEVFAAEMLVRCELATLIKTETEIEYDTEGKITDILMEIDTEKVGVSVVRAVGFPKDDPYTVEQATTILERKLNDILVSSANVSADDRWVKQILHVLAWDEPHVASLRTAWETLPEATRADTIVIVTVTHGADTPLY